MNILANSVPEKDKVDFSNQKDVASYILDKVRHPISDDMTDEDKTKFNDSIDRKLKSGKKLTRKEEQYLKETNPQMYMQYLRIRQRAEAVKEQLKHAKSKQQANNIIMQATAGVSDKDPCKEYVFAAIHNVSDEFRSSRAYQKLPNTDAEIKKHSSKNNNFEEKEDSEEEEFDPMSWSPLQEMMDAMPNFDMPV